MLLATLVETSGAVGATRSRKAKVAALAELLRSLEPDEVEVAVGFLTGARSPGPHRRRLAIGLPGRRRAGRASRRSRSSRSTGSSRSWPARPGAGSQAARQALLADLFARATEPEVDFVRRLLTGELRQGALAGVMTDAVATAAGVPIDVVRRAAMLSGDLGRTAALALTEGQEALEAVRLAVLHPIQPMLAASAADVAEALGHTGRASVEWKLDGARVQVHRARRRGAHLHPQPQRHHRPARRRRGAGARPARSTSVVLDGEVLGVHEDATPQAFQDTMSAFGRDGAVGRGGAPARAVLRRPPPRRRRPHRRAARRAPASPRRGGRRAGHPAGRAPPTRPRRRRSLDDALAQGHEGAMVKALDSTYDAGRRGGSWRKVKPVKTLDLVVLAAEWGSGRRQGWLSNLHLGARDPDGGFVMVGKTFKGLTDELLAWQTEALLERETHRDGPHGVRAPGAGRRDRPRRRADQPPLPRRRGAAVRPGARATAPTRTPRTPTSSPPCRRCGPGLRRPAAQRE